MPSALKELDTLGCFKNTTILIEGKDDLINGCQLITKFSGIKHLFRKIE